MAFTQSTFAPVGGMSSQAPSVYSYRSTDDIATISATSYFVNKVFQLEEGDFILCHASDGNFVGQVDSDLKTITRVFESSTDIANYPFTSDLLDTVNGYALVSDVDPTPSASGIAVTTANNSKIPYTGLPANDFELTFTVRFDSADAIPNMMYNLDVGGGNRYYFSKESATGRFRLVKISSSGTLSMYGTATGTSHDGRTFDFTYSQNAVTGVSVSVIEAGGSGYTWSASDSGTVALDDTSYAANIPLLTGGALSFKDVRYAPL